MNSLSIAIPTYNRAEKLKNTLNNLISQIKENNLMSEIEIIISDNNSEDNTRGVVEDFQKKNPEISIKYNKNDKNYGWENFKIASMKAKNNYVWICSDDDILDSKILKVICDTINKNPKIDYIHIPSIQSKVDFSGTITIKKLLEENCMCGALISSNIFRREAVKDIQTSFMTWFHLDLLFNLENIDSNCIVLPKMIDVKMPDNPKYWNNDFKKKVDYNTEMIELTKMSKLPENIKSKVYKHYKGCLPKEIKGYRKNNDKDIDFQKKCAKRLEGVKGFLWERLKLKYT